MGWLGAILLITLPGLLALVLIFSLLHQDNANRRFVPVDAVIHSTEIRRHSGKSTTYSPEATYSYRVNGTEHTSTDVLATSNSSSHSWAEDMLSQIQRRGPAGPEGTPEYQAAAELVRVAIDLVRVRARRTGIQVVEGAVFVIVSGEQHDEVIRYVTVAVDVLADIAFAIH